MERTRLSTMTARLWLEIIECGLGGGQTSIFVSVRTSRAGLAKNRLFLGCALRKKN